MRTASFCCHGDHNSTAYIRRWHCWEFCWATSVVCLEFFAATLDINHYQRSLSSQQNVTFAGNYCCSNLSLCTSSTGGCSVYNISDIKIQAWFIGSISLAFDRTAHTTLNITVASIHKSLQASHITLCCGHDCRASIVTENHRNTNAAYVWCRVFQAQISVNHRMLVLWLIDLQLVYTVIIY